MINKQMVTHCDQLAASEFLNDGFICHDALHPSPDWLISSFRHFGQCASATYLFCAHLRGRMSMSHPTLTSLFTAWASVTSSISLHCATITSSFVLADQFPPAVIYHHIMNSCAEYKHADTHTHTHLQCASSPAGGAKEQPLFMSEFVLKINTSRAKVWETIFIILFFFCHLPQCTVCR